MSLDDPVHRVYARQQHGFQRSTFARTRIDERVQRCSHGGDYLGLQSFLADFGFRDDAGPAQQFIDRKRRGIDEVLAHCVLQRRQIQQQCD